MSDERNLAEVAARLRIAFELFETGVELRRQQLRRAFPERADSEIEDLLAAWLRERPGAEHGDTIGRPTALGNRPNDAH